MLLLPLSLLLVGNAENEDDGNKDDDDDDDEGYNDEDDEDGAVCISLKSVRSFITLLAIPFL